MINVQNSKFTGFDYIAGPDAQIIILGSMPGIESIKQQQYYAHPRNCFWNIMDEMIAAGRGLAYPKRLLKLKQHHIALWDVAHQCERNGSLDSNIKSNSIIPNDFSLFFANHSRIKTVFFNGRKAADIYQKRVIPTLTEPLSSLPCHILPSTSPAHAAMSYQSKLSQWLQITDFTDTITP